MIGCRGAKRSIYKGPDRNVKKNQQVIYVRGINLDGRGDINCKGGVQARSRKTSINGAILGPQTGCGKGWAGRNDFRAWSKRRSEEERGRKRGTRRKKRGGAVDR